MENTRRYFDSKINNVSKAAIWMSITCFFGTLINVFVKILATKAVAIPYIVFGYNFMCALLILPLIFLYKVTFSISRLPLHIGRSVFSSAAFIIYFYALQYTYIGNAVAITFVDPILTCIFSYFIFKDAISRENFFSLVVAFMAALLIIKPGTSMFKPINLLVLLSTLFWAISNIFMKLISNKEDGIMQIFYMSFFTSIIALAFGYLIGDSFPRVNQEEVFLILCTAIAAVIHYYAIYKAFSFANASDIMPFFFLNIVFSEIFGYFIFAESHDLTESIGIGIILLSNFYLIYKRIRYRKRMFS